MTLHLTNHELFQNITDNQMQLQISFDPLWNLCTIYFKRNEEKQLKSFWYQEIQVKQNELLKLVFLSGV